MIRLRSIRALVDDPEAAERLFRARSSEDAEEAIALLARPRFAGMAAVVLGELRARKAVDPLIEVLQSSADRGARACAATALAQIGDLRAVPSLMARLSVESDEVARYWIIHALGEFGDERASSSVAAHLTDSNRNIRETAANALALIGDAGSANAVRAAASKEPWYRRGPYENIARVIEKRHGTREST